VLGTSSTAITRWEAGADPGRHAAAYNRLLLQLRAIADSSFGDHGVARRKGVREETTPEARRKG
jgi:hypothetical protein